MKQASKKILRSLFVLLIMTMFMSFALAAGEANEAVQADKDAIFEVTVVHYNSSTGKVDQQLSGGTGFLIGDDNESGARYIITNAHVVELTNEEIDYWKEALGIASNETLDTSIEVIIKGDVSVGAKVKYMSGEADQDWALLELDQPIYGKKVLGFNLEGVADTEDVFAMGFPDIAMMVTDFPIFTTDDISVTKGSVQKTTSIRGYNYYQHSATLSSGNSGGPLLDDDGYVIGVNTYSADALSSSSSYFFSLDINVVYDVLQTFGIPVTIKSGAATPTTEPTEAVKPTEKAEPTPSDKGNDDSKDTNDKKEDTEKDDDQKSSSVDTSDLEDVIEKAEKLDSKDYTEESYERIEKALKEAKKALDSDDQDEIDAAVKTLNNRINNAEKKDNLMLYLIIGGCALALILLIIIIVAVSKSKRKKIVNTPPYGGGYKPTPSPVQPPIQTPPTPPTPPYNPNPMGYQTPSGGSTFTTTNDGAGETSLLNAGSGETTLLSASNQVPAALVRTKTGEKVSIAKQEFRIGKERNKVDYCIANNSVSRQHAIITYRNGAYYVKDNNSTNLTYVNNTALSAGQEVQLNNNDRVKFSDEEFQFKLQ